MRKEIILAIIFGVVVAGGASFFIYRQQSLEELASLESEVISVLDDEQEQEDEVIRILEPTDESVHTDQAVIVRGQTWPNALVVIFINDGQDIVLANDEGQFSLAVNLEPGSNLITAHVVDEENNQFYDRVVAVFTTRPLDEVLVTEEDLQRAVAGETDEDEDENDDD
ncbi:MAG: hypothetical protein LBG64_01080 [Pseudomonadales bacterium]|jgi:hypothetical protein|nr:hypothetical protein [Pseudomonadales bacterium]